jgi:hypothetical protein
MARLRKTTPTYIIHKQSGKGRLQWYDALGLRQEKVLPGKFGSAESLAAKARLELEIASSSTRAPARSNDHISLAEVLAVFMNHAEHHYRTPDGEPTSEVREFKIVARFLRELYGEMPVKDFGPLAMKAVREKFIGEGWCRKTINQRTARIVRMLKWGLSEELVPPAVYQSVTSVTGLRQGRTIAPDPEPVRPVPDDVGRDFALLAPSRPGDGSTVAVHRDAPRRSVRYDPEPD